MGARMRAVVAFVVDLVLVAVFVGIGRASHREDQSALAVTFWPFAVGLVAGWLAARGWRTPFGVLRTAVPAWLATVAVGMVLRGISGQGVQPAFVVVASIVVGAFLLGWRALLLALDRSATRRGGTPGPVGSFLRRR